MRSLVPAASAVISPARRGHDGYRVRTLVFSKFGTVRRRTPTVSARQSVICAHQVERVLVLSAPSRAVRDTCPRSNAVSATAVLSCPPGSSSPTGQLSPCCKQMRCTALHHQHQRRSRQMYRVTWCLRRQSVEPRRLVHVHPEVHHQRRLVCRSHPTGHVANRDRHGLYGSAQVVSWPSLTSSGVRAVGSWS